ncbi:MAG: hypothetical protein PHC39_04965 [Proteiniphilum sp.]|nr:hypothetical protein [Proteiniphilum sp.]
MKPIKKFWFNTDEQRLYITTTIPKEADSVDAGTTETYTIDKNGFTLIESNGKKSHVSMDDFQFAMIDYIIENDEE